MTSLTQPRWRGDVLRLATPAPQRNGCPDVTSATCCDFDHPGQAARRVPPFALGEHGRDIEDVLIVVG